MSPLDKFACRFFSKGKNTSPIFIIGPPRSGTTLLYQTMVDYYNLAYITNFTANYPTIPFLATLLIKPFIPMSSLRTYKSNFGKTEGMFGPHECGAFWYRWFPKGMHVYVPENELSEKAIQEMRENVVSISSLFNAPIIFKNVYNSMRIAPLLEAFPNASFIICNRNKVDTSQSILNSRIKMSGDKSKWKSVPPKEIDQILDLPYYEQIVDQVYFVYKQIAEDRSQFGDSFFLEISYEDLCNDSYKTLEDIELFLKSRGHNLQRKGDIPPSFPVSTGIKVDENDYQLIVNEVEKKDWNF